MWQVQFSTIVNFLVSGKSFWPNAIIENAEQVRVINKVDE